MEPTLAQVVRSNKYETAVSQRKPLHLSVGAAYDEYHNNDFEMVVKMTKQLETVLKENYEAHGEGLGKINTVNCIIGTEINLFPIIRQ